MAEQPLFSLAFLRSRWDGAFAEYRATGADALLRDRLTRWAERKTLNETQEQTTFITEFFAQTWGYHGSGQRPAAEGYTYSAQHGVEGAGQGGGRGAADLALGYFAREDVPDIAQVLCEFKDIKSGLDDPQRRKGNTRSPVQQCADYLREAARGLRFGAVEPTWALVTDMNEFRLYWRDTMPSAFQRFEIKKRQSASVGLLDDGDDATFLRFVFSRLFHRDSLLTTSGPCRLLRDLREQGAHEKKIEADFYREYHDYREHVFATLIASNPAFIGTRGKLVRLTQRFLDRCLFVLFCEDMGDRLGFPHQLLRDFLIERSVSKYYDPDASDIWNDIKRLFDAMRDGTRFGANTINRFNGGLFEHEPDLDALVLPNRLFCVKGQGEAPDRWSTTPLTLLHLSASYFFGVEGEDKPSLSLYALGHIFEQSITDLELMEAKADDRPSLTELSKRKRDGVYYTPEWVTFFLVEHTLGTRLAELRTECDVTDPPVPTAREIAVIRGGSVKKSSKKPKKPGKRLGAKHLLAYLDRLDAYEREVTALKVVDPACGSGAFLIQALNALVRARQWIAAERDRIRGTTSIFDTYSLVMEVLAKNIYGVDINAESVEITRLALWLRTALPDRPLSELDKHIRCGNSLVGSDFYKWRQEPLDEAERERINVFDWEDAFPEVFGRDADRAGFDVVIGNPPYVKLQNFRKVEAPVAEYLVAAQAKTGGELYKSTQTGNFDMYLPFVERGVKLLNASGRMGFIAPNVWVKNEYGEGLRGFVHARRCLDRFVDFGDYQVFDEAITYTALQFFRGMAVDDVRCMFPDDNAIGGTEWDHADASVAYAELSATDEWMLLPDAERNLLAGFANKCERLDKVALGIIVGLQTSCDDVFHLHRVTPGRYRSFAHPKTPLDVVLEDEVMRPLVSGEDAKRYLVPSPETYLLFPYDDSGDRGRLLSVAELESRFPKAWAYLRVHERKLRERESGAFDDADWYRFGRNQNIDKQKLPKLGVAQTVPEMRVFYDAAGALCLNNVRVNGILTRDAEDAWFLLGVLNAPVADYVFRRIAKPKEGGFFEANKQFIAPLPIPRVDADVRREVARRAEGLQRLHTERRDAVVALGQRLGRARPAPRPITWLWEDAGIDGTTKRGQRANATTGRAREHLDALGALLAAAKTLSAAASAGELALLIDDVAAVRVSLTVSDGPFVLAQWRNITRSVPRPDRISAEKLVDRLLALVDTENDALRTQVIELDERVGQLDVALTTTEAQMNDTLYAAYGLTADEREMVERDRTQGRRRRR